MKTNSRPFYQPVHNPYTRVTRTFEGGPARIPSDRDQLLRRVANLMLFEDTFYQSGDEVAKEIAGHCAGVPDARDILEIALLARNDFKLRHAPLFLVAQADKRRAELPAGYLKGMVAQIVQRPDEMGELLSIIQKENGGRPLKKVLSAQVKKGLAAAFPKFNAYQLAKWNRDAEIKLKDVMFLVHPKPKDRSGAVVRHRHKERHVDGQGHTWMQLVEGTLPTADTWETALSAGADKKATWTRLIYEGGLGDMATVMNLRNMIQAGVEPAVIQGRLSRIGEKTKLLPFRFVSAAKHAPAYAQDISDAMVRAIDRSAGGLPGTTAVLIDVSGSMDVPIAGKSELLRYEAAGALAVLARELCASGRIFTFSNSLVEVPSYQGLALMNGIATSQSHGGTALGAATKRLLAEMPEMDRLIIITDEQSYDPLPAKPEGLKGYVINVAPYRPGLTLEGGWVRISGFSERIFDWLRWHEAAEAK